MIIVQQKPLNQIHEMTKNHKQILILGCDGCAAIIQAGGEKQAQILKQLLEMKRKLTKSPNLNAKAISTLRQCDRQITANALNPIINKYDAVLSLACGVGVQTLAEIYPNKDIIPANDTKFIGTHETPPGTFLEYCRACGDCILNETAGICPITRCAKSLLNGPCGGQSKGKCEVGGGKNDCAWVLIYNRLKDKDQLHLFTKFHPPKDYRISEHPREISPETTQQAEKAQEAKTQ